MSQDEEIAAPTQQPLLANWGGFLKANDKTEKVLKIRQSARSSREEIPADLVASYRFAKAIAKIQLVSDLDIKVLDQLKDVDRLRAAYERALAANPSKDAKDCRAPLMLVAP